MPVAVRVTVVTTPAPAVAPTVPAATQEAVRVAVAVPTLPTTPEAVRVVETLRVAPVNRPTVPVAVRVVVTVREASPGTFVTRDPVAVGVAVMARVAPVDRFLEPVAEGEAVTARLAPVDSATVPVAASVAVTGLDASPVNAPPATSLNAPETPTKSSAVLAVHPHARVVPLIDATLCRANPRPWLPRSVLLMRVHEAAGVVVIVVSPLWMTSNASIFEPAVRPVIFHDGLATLALRPHPEVESCA